MSENWKLRIEIAGQSLEDLKKQASEALTHVLTANSVAAIEQEVYSGASSGLGISVEPPIKERMHRLRREADALECEIRGIELQQLLNERSRPVDDAVNRRLAERGH